jgi:hypothetical protein
MRWAWKWNDLLAFLLVLLTFVSIVVVIPLVQDDPGLKRVRATKECQALARAIRTLPELDQRESARRERGSGSVAFLYTWDAKVDQPDSLDRWPHVSEKIRPWRDYKGPSGVPSTALWNVRKWLEGYMPDSLIEKERLMKAKRVGFDPWGRPYLINIGNMRKTGDTKPGVAWITWALSAGANGVIETLDYERVDPSEPEVTRDREVTQGDDIGCIVAMRRAP